MYQVTEETQVNEVYKKTKETHSCEVFQLIQETQSSKAHRISQVAPMQRVSRQKKGNRKLEAHLMNRVVPNEMSEP